MRRGAAAAGAVAAGVLGTVGLLAGPWRAGDTTSDVGAEVSAAAALTEPPPGVAALPGEGFDTVVERVVDGDTLVVDGGARVRLIGVDTPESVDPRQPVECFGREAAAFTAALVPAGTAVRLLTDAEPRDRFGRLLAYVWRLDDGLFVNAALVREGYAELLSIPPNVAYADHLATLAAEARAEGRGLWRACEESAGADPSAAPARTRAVAPVRPTGQGAVGSPATVDARDPAHRAPRLPA